MTDRSILTEHKRVETAVRAIAEGVSAATGEAFFRSLMQYLAKTLAADYAFVGEMSPEHDNMIRTVAFYADGQIVPNFAYDLRDTPCQNVTSGTLCVYPDRIQSRFPHDRSLAKMGNRGLCRYSLMRLAGARHRADGDAEPASPGTPGTLCIHTPHLRDACGG
jgi:hypothetical protein